MKSIIKMKSPALHTIIQLPSLKEDNMIRKITSIFLALILIVAITACGTQSPTTSPAASSAAPETSAAPSSAAPESSSPVAESYYIGFSILTTQGDFMSLLSTQLEERITALGHKFEVASADLNPAKQIEQIENFISLGVDEILVMAVDPSSLSDVLKKANDAGIKVVAFSQETTVYDVFIGTDEFAAGKAEAEMASKWIDATFPDAAPGSIEVAIFENRDKPTAAIRSDGLKEIAALNSKVTIAATVGVDTTNEGGQTAAENLFLTNPNVKVILSYNADTAMGVDAYAMSLNSAIKDKATFATFGIDFNGPAIDALKKSVTNESIWRGTIMMGKSLEQLFINVVNNCIGALDGTLKSNKDLAVLYQITPENVDDAAAGTID